MDISQKPEKTLPFIPNLVGISISKELYGRLFPFHNLYYKDVISKGETTLTFKDEYTVKYLNKGEEVHVENNYDATTYRSHFKYPNFIYQSGIKGLKCHLQYNIETKEISINESFLSKLITPNVLIGELYSLQNTIKSLILMDLFLNGFYVSLGAAFQNTETNKSTTLIMPRHNGKTTLINKLLSQGKYEYISENLLIMDLYNMQAYQYPPEWFHNKHQSRLIKTIKYPKPNTYVVDKILMRNNTYNAYSLSIYEQYLLSNPNSNINTTVMDYVMLSKQANIYFESLNKQLSKIEELQEKGILDCNAVNKYNFGEFL